MKKTLKLLFLLTVLLLWRCREVYINPNVPASVNYLTVEGYISANGPTKYSLSHTIPLPGDSTIQMEANAEVQVEGDDNSVNPLLQQTPGVYAADSLPLSSTVKYRLRITTQAGKVYLSDYVPYRQTPPIDSISWVYDGSKVTIYVNTHDPANATRYYQWQDVETWQYNSAEQSSLMYQASNNTVVLRPIEQQIYTCWENVPSTEILLGNTTRLSQDVVAKFPLLNIPNGSPKISVLYSIIVQQTALTEDGYNYLSILKKNTESLGSIFDAQPSELHGNIHCINNPGELVLGNISAGDVRQQRIYISPDQVYLGYFPVCQDTDVFVANNPDRLRAFFSGGASIPLYNKIQQGVAGFGANAAGCVDCRLKGGTTQKPSFWP